MIPGWKRYITPKNKIASLQAHLFFILFKKIWVQKFKRLVDNVTFTNIGVRHQK